MEKQIIHSYDYYKVWLNKLKSNYTEFIAEEVDKRIQNKLREEYGDTEVILTNLRILRLNKWITDMDDIKDFMTKQLNASCDSFVDIILHQYKEDNDYSSLYVIGFDVVIARYN